MRVKRGAHWRTVFRIVLALVGALLLHIAVAAAGGYWLLTRAPVDPLAPVDAVVVLGGQHDGREERGIELAKATGATTVLLSDPYSDDDATMRRLCGTHVGDIEVLCFVPHPSTTRGEALAARAFAQRRGWSRIVVVSWRYHLPRARIVFEQCYSRDSDAVIMRPAPRPEAADLDGLVKIYDYQLWAAAKALTLGDCSE